MGWPLGLCVAATLLLFCVAASREDVAANSSPAASKPAVDRGIDRATELKWMLDQAEKDLATQAAPIDASRPVAFEQIMMLGELAKVQMKAGEKKQALATCDRIEGLRAQLPKDDAAADEASGMLGQVLADAGELDRAEALAAQLHMPSGQSMVWGKIAEEQAKRGDLAAAKTTLAKIMGEDGTRGGLRSSAYFNVAVIQIRAGDLEGARRMLAEGGMKEESSFTIARVRAGDVSGAKAALLGAAGGKPDPFTLFEAAETAVKQRKRDLALEFVRAGEAAAMDSRPEFFGQSGRIRAMLGDAVGSHQAFQRAWELVDQQKLQGIREAYAASQISSDMTEAGRAAEALQLLRGLKLVPPAGNADPSDDPAAKVDLAIAAIQGYSGDVAAARATMEHSAHHIGGPDGIHEVAGAAAAGDGFDGLKQWLSSLQNREERVSLELAAAEGIINRIENGPQ